MVQKKNGRRSDEEVDGEDGRPSKKKQVGNKWKEKPGDGGQRPQRTRAIRVTGEQNRNSTRSSAASVTAHLGFLSLDCERTALVFSAD